MELKEQILEQLNSFKAELTTAIEAKAMTGVETKFAAIKTAVDAQIEELKKLNTADELKALKEANEELKSQFKTTVEAFDAFQLKYKAGDLKTEKKSFNDYLSEVITEKTDDVEKFIRKETKSLKIEMKAVADFSTSNVTGGSVWGAQYKPGIIQNQNAITHLREIVPVQSAGPGTDYYFMKENGAGEGSIAATAEKGVTAATTQATGLKPAFDLDLVESSVKFEIIAGYMLASNKSLNNIPGVLSFLQARIPHKLMDAEDQYVLYGTGTSPQIKGILVSGNYTAGSAAGTTPLAEKIINDLSLLEDTYKRSAGVIVMRPADYWGFFKNKASGSGEYDLPQNVIFNNGQLYISGVPVVKCSALADNDYFVMAAGGVDLLQQQGMALEFFREDGTNVRTNQTTIRIEETIALPVYGSDYVIKGSSATS